MQTLRAPIITFTSLISAALLAGCAIGLDSVLFLTKTEVAIDVDSQPPSLDIGYARREAVLAPVFQDGQVLPVLTTIGARPSALEFGSNQSFATGDAALVMADKLTEPGNYQFGNGTDRTKVQQPDMASVIETTVKPPDGFWQTLGYYLFGSSERKRYFFGTDTNFGLHVEWQGSQFPRSLALGFRRKELAFIPLIEKVDSADPQKKSLKLASLLATANIQSKVGEPSETGVEIGQTFATGSAATLLAKHEGVRKVLGPSIIPKFNEIEAELRAQSDRFREQTVLVDWIKRRFEDSSTTSEQKDAILAKSLELKVVPDGTDKSTFVRQLGGSVDRSNQKATERHTNLKNHMEKQLNIR